MAISEVVKLAVFGLLCEGHVLLDDFPGVGKTLLSKALARSLHASFKSIQFTPGLLPTDIIRPLSSIPPAMTSGLSPASSSPT